MLSLLQGHPRLPAALLAPGMPPLQIQRENVFLGRQQLIAEQGGSGCDTSCPWQGQLLPELGVSQPVALPEPSCPRALALWLMDPSQGKGSSSSLLCPCCCCSLRHRWHFPARPILRDLALAHPTLQLPRCTLGSCQVLLIKLLSSLTLFFYFLIFFIEDLVALRNPLFILIRSEDLSGNPYVVLAGVLFCSQVSMEMVLA